MKLSLPIPPFAKELVRQPGTSPRFRVLDLSCISFNEALAIQQYTLQGVFSRRFPDTLVFCEHPPTITLGRLAKEAHVLVSLDFLRKKGIEIFRIGRGGDVTYHEPGQLVVYPIFNLADHGKDLRRFLYQLEEVVIDFLGYFGIKGIRRPGLTGVWIAEKKIASIGIGVKKWVTFHGIAVNLINDLKNFSLIRPCGMEIEMISLQHICKDKIDLAWAKMIMKKSFQQVFNGG